MSKRINKSFDGLVECYRSVIKTNKPSLILAKKLNVVMLPMEEYELLINKEIPMKPLKRKRFNNSYECPICEERIEYLDGCSNNICRQKIDWS